MRRMFAPGVPTLLLLAFWPVALEARQATISGTVVDRHTDVPVADVSITIEPGGIVRATDASGRFELPALGVGEYIVVFSHVAYRTRTDTLLVDRPGALDAVIRLDPSPVPLDPLRVDAAASPVLARAGFYARKAEVTGHFIERSEIERRDPRLFTDLFFTVPGVNMRNRSIGNQLIRFNRVTGLRSAHPDGCVPDLYVDGMIVGGAPGRPALQSHDIIDPASIEGIEVYMGATTPIQYRSPCGVVLVWTRRGG